MAAGGSVAVMSEHTATPTVQAMSIACPAGWRDASMLIITAEQSSQSGVTPNLVVTRERLPDDFPSEPASALREFVHQQIDGMRATLTGFTEVSSRHASPDRPSANLTIKWVSNGVPVMQALTYALSKQNDVVISTATASEADFPELDTKFRFMLQSFRTG